MALREGSLFWAHVIVDGKGESRACVVTFAPPYDSHVVEAVYGQGKPFQSATPGAPAPHGVGERSPLGLALGLSKFTYFCSRVHIYKVAIERHCADMCPDLDLLAIQEIAESQRLD